MKKLKMKKLRIVKENGKYVIDELENKKNYLDFTPKKWIRWAERENSVYENYIDGRIRNPMVFDTIESCLDKIKKYVGQIHFDETEVRIVLS